MRFFIASLAVVKLGTCAVADRPVTKVVALLKDMASKLEAESTKDQEVYEKMDCWCKTNKEEKTQAIETAKSRITSLSTEIEDLKAKSMGLEHAIKGHEKEVKNLQVALTEATSMREKELAEFNAEEKDLAQSISALKAAVAVLSKHSATGFLQSGNVISETLREQLQRQAGRFGELLTPSERKTVAAFLSQPGLGGNTNFQDGYANQSGQIFGILQQMLETFEKNLKTSQGEENSNLQQYTDLKAAKEQEIAATTEQIDSKTQQAATVKQQHADASVDLEDTEKALAADTEFLEMVKGKCSMTDAEWEERQQARRTEIEAVSKAIEILNADDAHDTFGRTFGAKFLQLSESEISRRRVDASRVLSSKTASPRLSALAYRVKLDAFEKVKAAIDKMVSELLKEKADEIKHKDFCTEEFNNNQLQTEKKKRTLTGHHATLDTLESTNRTLTKEIEELDQTIADMREQLKRAGEDREQENKVFQTTVADQRESQRLLASALNVLKKVYQQAAFAQREPGVGTPSPAGFEAYKKNAGAKGVLGLLEDIIQDAKKTEAESIRAEADSQKGYEDLVKDTNNNIVSRTEEKVNKEEALAKTGNAIVDENQDKDSTEAGLKSLSEYKGELHQSCDFILQNFDLRQSTRDDEVDALRQAKEILSGSKST